MRRSIQKGMTLPELMISITIGLFLTGGMIQVFLSTKGSYSLQERLGDLQENGRYAQYFLQRSIRMAGYPKSAGAFAIRYDGANPTQDGGANADDRITIEFEAPLNGWVDCVGQTVAAGATITESFYIEREPNAALSAENQQNRLMCAVTSTTNPAVQAQPLLEGIENMQILYGVDDTTADGVPAAQGNTVNNSGWGYANQYLRADQVAALGGTLNINWGRVVSVRIALLVSAMEPVYGGDDDANALTRTFTLLDAAGIAGPSVTSLTGVPRPIRAQVFTTTIEIRNRSGV